MNVFNLKEFTDMNVFAIFGYRYLLILCALSIGGLVLVLINSSKELQNYRCLEKPHYLYILFKHSRSHLSEVVICCYGSH